MKRILLDQGLPLTASGALRTAGWDCLHAREIEMHRASDEGILEYAARESRVVVTLDRDFPRILAITRASRPSVVFVRQQKLRTDGLVALLTSVWDEHQAALDAGCIARVTSRGSKSRRLPLA